MSSHVTREIDRGTRTVNGVEVRIVELHWNDSSGLSFDVYRTEDDECLTMDESFDEMPGDDAIADLIEADRDAYGYRKLTAGHALHVLPVIGCASCEAISPGEWRERYSDYREATEGS